MACSSGGIGPAPPPPDRRRLTGDWGQIKIAGQIREPQIDLRGGGDGIFHQQFHAGIDDVPLAARAEAKLIARDAGGGAVGLGQPELGGEIGGVVGLAGGGHPGFAIEDELLEQGVDLLPGAAIGGPSGVEESGGNFGP